jgi:hypothetical protein
LFGNTFRSRQSIQILLAGAVAFCLVSLVYLMNRTEAQQCLQPYLSALTNSASNGPGFGHSLAMESTVEEAQDSFENETISWWLLPVNLIKIWPKFHILFTKNLPPSNLDPCDSHSFSPRAPPAVI